MNVYEIITDKILSQLESGTIPWKQPWRGGGPAKNLVSKKDYRGINVFILAASGYPQPYWVSYKQAKELGGFVKPGEKGTAVVFWKMLDVADKSEDGETVKKTVPLLRYYTVFNVSQCERLDVPELERETFEPIPRCEAMVENMPEKPEIRHGEARAYYRPTTDTINMPAQELFRSEEEYYSTLFHELTHSTGHEKRLGRKTGDNGWSSFGDGEYSKEELVAEMGAAFLCGTCGIETATLENSAAYVAGWLKALRDDTKLVVHAAAQAQKAADYILGKQTQGE